MSAVLPLESGAGSLWGGGDRWAVLSADGCYRYALGRRWGPGPVMALVMLNPSSADAQVDDPTVRRCVGFAVAAGCGGLVVVNLYAWRAADPRMLGRVEDPVGPDNDAWISRVLAGCAPGPVVAAWGARADAARVETVLDLLAGYPLFCLGVTAAGYPRHPLYVPDRTRLQPFRAAGMCGSDHDWTRWSPVGAFDLEEVLEERVCLVCGTDELMAADGLELLGAGT